MTNLNKESFTFCPKCGEKNLHPNDIKSFHCTNCNFLFFINTAAATVAVIFDEENKLLVVERNCDPGKGTLDLPGGFSDPDESAEETLIREVKEELNLNIFSLRYFTSVPNEYFYKNVHYTTLDMVFICQVKSFEKISAMDDVADYKFTYLHELNESQFGLKSIKKIIQLLKQTYSE